MGDILGHLNRYLFLNLLIFFACSICVIGGCVFNFANQLRFETTDGELVFKIRRSFFIVSIICNILMLMTDIVLLVIYRLKRVRYFYFAIFFIGFIVFFIIFLSTYAGFSETNKLKDLDDTQKKYNEEQLECCFKNLGERTCGCPLEDQTQCQICEDMVGNTPFFVTFCANSIGMMSLFGGVYLGLLYWFKKIKQRADHYDMDFCEYVFNVLKGCGKKKQQGEHEALIDDNNGLEDVAVDGETQHHNTHEPF